MGVELDILCLMEEHRLMESENKLLGEGGGGHLNIRGGESKRGGRKLYSE